MKVTPTGPTLPELEAEFDALMSIELDPDDEESLKEFEKVFKDLESKLTPKIDGYLSIIRSKYNNAGLCRQESKRLSDMAWSVERQAETMKEFLFRFMERHHDRTGKHRINGLYHKVWIQENSTAPKPWIDPELTINDLDEEYIIPEHTITVPAQIDFEKISSDAEEFGMVRSLSGKIIAKRLPRGKHLRIK